MKRSCVYHDPVNTPQLKDIFDQPEAVDFLRRAIIADRLPHGLVFAGPAGVGKGTTATALAAVFLCLHPTVDDPTGLPAACGACESCRGMAAGERPDTNHPDYHRIHRLLIRIDKDQSKALNLPIDVIRQYLVEPANRKPMLNNGKVFVIEEAELMNPAAQNALLKTLEEPYGKTLLILLSDQPDSLLQTIRSRCQVVRFAALPRDRVINEMKSRGIDPATAADAADFADGSLGMAIKWTTDDVIPHARRLEMLLKRILAGSGDATELLTLIQTAADEYAAKQLAADKYASKPQATRDGLLIYFKLIAQALRTGLREGGDADHLEQLCAGIDAVARAESYLESNVNVSLLLQQLALALEGGAKV